MSQNIIEYPSLGTPPAGSIRFNTDSSKMEIYNGEQWWEIDSTSPDEQTGGTRGVFAGGYQPGSGNKNEIEFGNIDTTGNFSDFGNLTDSRRLQGGAGGDRTRGLFCGGRKSPQNSEVIDFITFASTGNAQDFGDISVVTGRSNSGTASNRTRTIIFSGQTNPSSPAFTNVISYVTTQSLGNDVDFGDAATASVCQASMASPTRAIFAGGYTPSEINTIDYITIQHAGNTADFGDLTQTVRRAGGCSNAVRGIIAGGNRYPSAPQGVDNIEYVTLSTLGNAIDFGNLTSSNAAANAACASKTRGVIHATKTSPGEQSNTLEYVQIMSAGNSIDFSDLPTNTIWGRGGTSNGHGGLG